MENQLLVNYYLIYLKKINLNNSLGGNIGTPILDFKKFKNNYVIIEASSFQFHIQNLLNLILLFF